MTTRPMMPFTPSPGLIGGPPDRGSAAQLKGNAKERQRIQEHTADVRMHTAKPAQRPTGASSGMEKAMAAHADKLHPAKR